MSTAAKRRGVKSDDFIVLEFLSREEKSLKEHDTKGVEKKGGLEKNPDRP